MEIHFFFAAALTFLLLCDRSGTAAAGLGAVFLHELGHLCCMHLQKVPAEGVRCTPFGMEILETRRARKSYKTDALIAFAGPAANFAVAGICRILSCFCSNIILFMQINFLLAVFQALPIESLDGGQGVYAVLCQKIPPSKAEKAVRVISFAVLLPLAALGFLVLFQSKYNFSLLLLSVYLMVLILLKKGRYF